jgi:hypothetical protein
MKYQYISMPIIATHVCRRVAKEKANELRLIEFIRDHITLDVRLQFIYSTYVQANTSQNIEDKLSKYLLHNNRFNIEK